jgi:predicted nucleic acid-binding protein
VSPDRSAAAQRTGLILAEPPAIYLTRPPLVLDCSVLCAVLFDEATRDEALRHLSGKDLHAPTLLDHEVANVAVRKQRQNLPAESIAMALADYADQPISLHRTDITAQVALARQYGLSGYDAAYLWLAAELKAPLATFDVKLGQAALQHLRGLT